MLTTPPILPNLHLIIYICKKIKLYYYTSAPSACLLAEQVRAPHLKTMTCYKPKPAREEIFEKIDEKTGEIYKSKRFRFLSWAEIDEQTPFKPGITMIPCGKCEGCRIDKANEWATRCALESQNHAKKCFLTLTYSNECLPKKRSLKKADLQKFWKRLRKQTGLKIIYLCCGEYGPRTLRPHYHAIVMGYWPKDAKQYKKNITEDMLYTSEELNKIWGLGYVIVGKVNYETSAYVARYVVKKAYGINNELHLKAGREKEFCLSSKRPAIGKWAFENKEKWAEIKRNNGILIKTKTGTKLKKIPLYLREFWKKFEDREEYYAVQDEQRARVLNETRARLEKTSDNYWQNMKKTIENIKEKLKRLDKRGNTEIK